MILNKSVIKLIRHSGILSENKEFIAIWSEGNVPISLIKDMISNGLTKHEHYSTAKGWTVEDHARRIAYFALNPEIKPIELSQIFNHPFYANGDFIIHDGFHRLTAFYIQEFENIPCVLIDGFMEDFKSFLTEGENV